MSRIHFPLTIDLEWESLPHRGESSIWGAWNRPCLVGGRVGIWTYMASKPIFYTIPSFVPHRLPVRKYKWVTFPINKNSHLLNLETMFLAFCVPITVHSFLKIMVMGDNHSLHFPLLLSPSPILLLSSPSSPPSFFLLLLPFFLHPLCFNLTKKYPHQNKPLTILF